MRKKGAEKRYKLSVFLIKEIYQKVEEFLRADGLERVEMPDAGPEQAILFYKGGYRNRPSWVSLFEDVPGFDPNSLWNQSSRAIYVLRHSGRWFCFTFGYARHLIDEHAYERNFGLLITLNMSDPKAIKAIDKTNIAEIARHSKEQSTKDIELANFDFDDEIDLLKSVTGKALDVGEDNYDTYSGRDSVSVYIRANRANFSEIAERLYAAFQDDTYRKIYPWIDKISEERDREIIERLDSDLVARIVDRRLQNIWLAVPEVVAWEDIRGFSFRNIQEKPNKNGPVLYQDLDIRKWISDSKIPDHLSVAQLKTRKAFIYWQDERPNSHWSIYRCLNAEAELNNEKYILNDAAWYRVEANFVKEVDHFYRSIPDSSLKLPNYGGMKEPEYLEFVAGTMPKFALMDRKEIMIGGKRSRVEFCDLFSINHDIVHVKRYGGSSLLSHLFSQAIVSGASFLGDEEFREKLNALLPESHRLTDVESKPDAAHYNVCIAIMSKVPGPLELPFFSRVTFKHAVKALRDLGYNVSKLKIEI